MIAKLEWNPTLGVTINNEATTESPPYNEQQPKRLRAKMHFAGTKSMP